ncbi:branched-chain amino acid aminotransferase [Propionibacterium freudenreichii]|uniref:branched-chain amino acid aminotransferase n=1 Tax=Propionibacterium freudenreichii TaxID=1744 RepID=UPI0004A0E1DE|nr:branched-chain amino acid aminotransferase [Propionibacterium freudenreichii]MDN6797825.1 branched-chain amino acid aminotransferase [Propionibacterium sp.]AWY95614.1 Branched-chain-amino-acid transaminase [Propionibacterium freudenreichii]MCT3012820.1 branched-chain amino acid aminotransferase [Propionibacterium freudenreichii]MCT3017692.1 branched-chain amino acid aminotransferase [Propionibacterium freudenreichii]MDK9299385.1 branched-chain amino acid aminotransferase [Propionibacterium 
MALKFNAPSDPTYRTEADIAKINEDPGFGVHFTDHMARIDWSEDEGWVDPRLIEYGPIPMDPAGAVFHYAQEAFEGLKAYHREDGSIWLFRPERNAARFFNSSKRLALPQLPVDDFVQAVRELTRLDARWVPKEGEKSLYLRPFSIATESFLGVRPSKTVAFCVIASPVGAYFSGGVKPVDIWVESHLSRVSNGGTGDAKCGGNYAASLVPEETAFAHGCNQVMFVDNAEHRWVEELGGMNFLMITKNDDLVTPPLNGNILPGVTRDSLLTIAPEMGLKPVERPIDIAEVYAGMDDGTISELFACGTAAVVTPIGSLTNEQGRHDMAVPADGGRTIALRNYLLDVQYGRREDTRGWTQRVV